MTQLALCNTEHHDTAQQPTQTVCLVVDGNSHAQNLLQDALPACGSLVCEALLPQIRTVAMLLAAERVDFSRATPDVLTDEADWFAARMVVLGVRRFHLDVSLLPMLALANERAAAFAAAHGLPFTPASMQMSLHADRASNVLLMEVDAGLLAEDGGVIANSLAVRRQVSLQSAFAFLM